MNKKTKKMVIVVIVVIVIIAIFLATKGGYVKEGVKSFDFSVEKNFIGIGIIIKIDFLKTLNWILITVVKGIRDYIISIIIKWFFS